MEKYNAIERMKMVKAMEFIVRNCNNEENIEEWLVCGVADGDIEYGDLDVTSEDEDMLDYYIDNESFRDLMELFLGIMSDARKHGGLYCNGVVS